MQELSDATKKLISQYEFAAKRVAQKPTGPTIHVDEFASSVASFYEKIRMVVDWKEEHLIRRTAITRKLKRRFLNVDINNAESSQSIAEPLILELIRGGHLPNDRIEETKITDVKKILDKYIFVLKNLPNNNNPREKIQFYNWLIEIASCEIEEKVASFRKESSLIEFMFDQMKKKIVLGERARKKWQMTNEEKNTQIYIAVQLALFKLDQALISYNLIKYKYPQWLNPESKFISETSNNFYNIWNEIDNTLSHPSGKKFYAICEKYDTPYLLLGDILSEDGAIAVTKKISEPQALEDSVKNAYKKRLSTLGKRLARASTYSTLSVLLTNALSVFILEIPIAKLIYGGFSSSPLLTISVDIMAPTIIMFFMVASIRKPPKDNLNLAILETIKIVYQKENSDTYEVKTARRGGVITVFILSFIYSATAVAAFAAIFFTLEQAKFPITSVVINIAFVAIIVFTGIAIRKKGQELTIKETKATFIDFLLDLVATPVAGVGRWLSNKWKKYNAVAAFFNALIDMPFTVFVEFLEQWRFFIKERKEEIR